MRYELQNDFGMRAVCDITIITPDMLEPQYGAVPTTVIASELPDNPGTSVTNMAEELATRVCRENNISPHWLLWIEHYPKSESREDATWTEVAFTFDWGRSGFPCKFSTPKWWRLSDAQMATLTGLLYETSNQHLLAGRFI